MQTLSIALCTYNGARFLIDRVHFYLTPILCAGPDVIGGLGAASTAESITFKNPRYEKIGGDVRMTADIQFP